MSGSSRATRPATRPSTRAWDQYYPLEQPVSWFRDIAMTVLDRASVQSRSEKSHISHGVSKLDRDLCMSFSVCPRPEDCKLIG